MLINNIVGALPTLCEGCGPRLAIEVVHGCPICAVLLNSQDLEGEADDVGCVAGRQTEVYL